MDIDLKKTEQLLESGKKKPVKTIITLIITLALIAIGAFIYGYCAKTGEQIAIKKPTESVLSNVKEQGYPSI